MEIANLESVSVQAVTRQDAGRITSLLQRATFSHTHADWRLPADWIGRSGFVLVESAEDPAELASCLAAAADPLPAAWVRLAAIRRSYRARQLLEAMLTEVMPRLKADGVTQLGWLAVESWPDRWLPDLGFERIAEIVTFVKPDVTLPVIPAPQVQVRPVVQEEIPLLAQIEERALAPLWRHSADGLVLGWRQAISFDVAVFDNRPVGFQYSVRSLADKGAHLVRIVVDPTVQQQGIGSALLAAAIAGYRQMGLNHVSLNTQADNIASHGLYRRFGFVADSSRLPIWAISL